MFATRARARPWAARVGCLSFSASRARPPHRPSTSNVDRGGHALSQRALRALHLKLAAARARRCTPSGVATGRFPITRHGYQTSQSTSPPTDSARACAVGEDALRRRQHGRVPSPLRTRGISPTPTYTRRPGPAHAAESVDDRNAVVVVPKPNAEPGLALVRPPPRHAARKPSATSTSGDRQLQLRRRAREVRVARLAGVPDAREHVCDGVGHHGRVRDPTGGTACRGGASSDFASASVSAVVHTVTFRPVIFSTLS